MVRFSVIPAAAVAMFLFRAEASPCRPSTTKVTSVTKSLTTSASDSTSTSLDTSIVTAISDGTTTTQEQSTETTSETSLAESLMTSVSDSTVTSLDITTVTTLVDVTTTIEEQSTATTTETSLNESLTTSAYDTTTVPLDVTTTTTLVDTTTTTAAAPDCVDTQLFVNPGFDNSASDMFPWTSNGALTQSEPQDGANALAFLFLGGGQLFGTVKQTLNILNGPYEFTYYYRVVSTSTGADYVCDTQLSVGEETIIGNYMEDRPGGWKEGRMTFFFQSDMGTSDVQFTVSCSGEYRSIQISVDSFGLTRQCNGGP